MEKGLVTVAVDDLHTDRGWNPVYAKLSVTAVLPLTIQHTIHTEQVYRDVVASKPLEVRSSSQLRYHDDFCPTVVD